MGRIELAPAAPDDWPLACRLALGGTPADVSDTRVLRLLQFVQTGKFDPAGLILALRRGTPVGAIAAQLLPGSTGVVLPPFGPDAATRVALVRAAREYFHRSGTVLAHCLLGIGESQHAAPLLAGGFRRITQIQHRLRQIPIVPDATRGGAEGLNFIPFSDSLESVFARVLERTYVDTLDLPETTVDRPASQQLAGYRQDQTDPPHWWLAERPGEDPIGVVMLSESEMPRTGEIAYLGLVPEARGRGFGQALILQGISAANRAGILNLGLSVDVRNSPAIQLYHDHLFRIYNLQDLYLLRLCDKN